MIKYFIYDPENGFETFKTLAEREAAEKKVLAAYGEEGDWPENTGAICSGTVTHRATKCDIKNRPEDYELDDNGCDEDGQDWHDYEYICNYEMKEIVPL